MSANSILAAAAEAAKTKSDEYVFMAVEQRVLRTIDGVIQISNIDSFGVRDSNNKNGVKGLLVQSYLGSPDLLGLRPELAWDCWEY